MELVSMILHAANIILLLVLLFIYLQNYRQLKNKITAGMMLFVVFFLAHSVMGLYFDASMAMYYSGPAEKAAMVLEGVKAAGFAVLVWLSWK